MTFVSPVKDGLGVSPLDRTLRDDTRTDLLYTELAALEAQNKATAARSASRSCDLRPIAEVSCGRIWCTIVNMIYFSYNNRLFNT